MPHPSFRHLSPRSAKVRTARLGALLFALLSVGCVQVVDFDPVGSDYTISASWTTAGADPDPASCGEQGITFIRVSFFDYIEDLDNPSERRVDHGGLIYPCHCQEFDTRLTDRQREALPEECRRAHGKVVRKLEESLAWNIRLLAIERQTGQVRDESERQQQSPPPPPEDPPPDDWIPHITVDPVDLFFNPLVPARPRGQWAAASAYFEARWDATRCGGATTMEVWAYPETDADRSNGVMLLSAPCADGEFNSTYLDDLEVRQCDASLGDRCYLRSGLYRLRYRGLDAAGAECDVVDRRDTFEVNSNARGVRLPEIEHTWCSGI